MRLTRTRLTGIAIASALAIGAACAGGVAYAGASSHQIVVKGPDHLRLSFLLAPGHGASFKLPAANDPIRVDIAKVSTNGGVQQPSEVFSALINVDANRAGMSWIGTYSDGSQHANNTIKAKTITELVCGTNCVIGRLAVNNVAARTVTINANGATSIIRERYVINIWY